MEKNILQYKNMCKRQFKSMIYDYRRHEADNTAEYFNINYVYPPI